MKLATADPNKLSQRWILRFPNDRTIIQNMQHKDYVLTGKGIDQPVLLQRIDLETDV